ncbi:MAG: hypothetical protein AAFN43_12670 [Pseudomonadota bacterium]
MAQLPPHSYRTQRTFKPRARRSWHQPW